LFLVKAYGIDIPFQVRYTDDEGDLISITTTEALNEAVRLAKETKPPILRVVVLDSPEKGGIFSDQTPPEEPQKQAPSFHEEQKEYPPLPVNEWDAPKKKKIEETPREVATVDSVPVKMKRSAPGTFSARISQQVEDTSAEVAQYSKDMVASMKGESETSVTCAQLSRAIMLSCVDIAATTSILCQKLAQAQSNETSTIGCYNDEELSTATAKRCQRLSEDTATMCTELAQATAMSMAGKEHEELVDISKQVWGTVFELSNRTASLSQQLSDEMKKTIMEM